MNNTVELFKSPDIYDSIQYYEVLKVLERKIEGDKKILEANLTLDNKINFGKNTLFYYQLYLDATTINSEIANSSFKYQNDGWFIWLQVFDYFSTKEFKSNDEKLTYFFDINFDKFFNKVSRDQLFGKYYYQSVKNYKEGNYFSCVCGLFPLIENIVKQISSFDGKTKFNIKKELSKNHVPLEQKYKDYFEKFESNMNSFLSNYIYSSSTESDEEPKVISRNRVLHGIFTRDINKTDCLKLFCIYCSLYSFNAWIETFTIVDRLKHDLKKLEEKKNLEEK